LDNTTALYFTVTVFATVGFGDIVAQTRRPVPLMRTPSHDADESWARAGCQKSDLGR
jgi:hypothetical protein